jgi:hypothetical protein
MGPNKSKAIWRNGRMRLGEETFKKSIGLMLIGAALLLLCSTGPNHFAQMRRRDLDEFNRLKSMVRNGRFDDAAKGLKELREKPFCKNFDVDYLLGASLCRIERRGEGMSYLEGAAMYPEIDDVQRGDVEKEINRCKAAPQQGHPSLVPVNDRGRRKGGFSTTGRKTFGMNLSHIPPKAGSAEFRPVRKILPEEFVGRLFEKSEAEEAILRLKNITKVRFNEVVAEGPFILASAGGHTATQLQEMGRSLERVFSFFVSEYQMPELPYLITVYLFPDPIQLDIMAREMHGIDLDYDTIGYFFLDDFSIAGTIPRTLHGTLKHELFHLLVRGNFGDIPLWLDEGMAALYESSEFSGSKVVGKRNWREANLRGKHRPSLSELVTMDWSSFNKRDVEEPILLRNHATARYFMLYLQEERKLTPVYKAIRDRRGGTTPAPPYHEVIRTIMGKSMLELDRDFARWLRRLR